MAEAVQIIAENVISTPLPGGQFARQLELTYQAVGLPPRRVYLPVELDSEKARQEAIKADLEIARRTGPTIINIP